MVQLSLFIDKKTSKGYVRHKMRGGVNVQVIAGKARRLLLKTIPGMETRPTQDRIKETLFNILQRDVPGCRFLDLFAGTGAIGIEALSRGAQRAVFVDNSRKAVACIRENLAHTHMETEATVMDTDALAAIQHLVFEKKEVSMERLLRAVRTDFNGEEVLRQKLRSDVKFGNDDDRADLIAKEIYEHFFRYLLTKHTWRGGIYGGGLSTFNRTADYGSHTGASANGRKNREPLLADSLGAEPGCDVKGPTAALLSAAKYDQTLAKSGLVMNIKFDKSLFVTERGEENFIRLWKTYFEKGGQQLSVNVVSREELLDAKEHPELHRDLIVRVGGFSEYFWKLPGDLQDNIIERSSFAV